jgi:hypothetical protein
VGGETEVTMGTSNDALATIAGLKQRVESLEEAIGKLLVYLPPPRKSLTPLTFLRLKETTTPQHKTSSQRETTAASLSQMHLPIWSAL